MGPEHCPGRISVSLPLFLAPLLGSETSHTCGPPGGFLLFSEHSERWLVSKCSSRLLPMAGGCVNKNFTLESHLLHKGMDRRSSFKSLTLVFFLEELPLSGSQRRDRRASC